VGLNFDFFRSCFHLYSLGASCLFVRFIRQLIGVIEERYVRVVMDDASLSVDSAPFKTFGPHCLLDIIFGFCKQKI
jgi:hypothetical protein